MKLNKRHAALITLYAIWPEFVFGGSLAEVPLGLRGAVPSNVLFAISVEWPTAITAAYPGVSDYDPGTSYEGLFDPNLCYDYDTNLGSDQVPALSPLGGFVPKATAVDNHECAGRWSGNFMNWVAMTGLDEFRYATMGGNRAIDKADRTVLERTYISGNGGNNSAKSCSGTNDSSFFKLKCVNPAITEFENTTPYTTNTTFKFDNLDKGLQMTVGGSWTTENTSTGASTISCTKQNSPTYCNAITLATDGTTGSCSAWATNGANDGSTSAKPIKCTAFGTFSSGATTNTITSIGTCNATAKNGNNKFVCTNYSVNYSKTTTTTNTVNDAYTVRVEACNKAHPLRDNCQQFSSGFYKPVGEIQRNGEKMRFGVFAYYNSSDIDNAVMRARLKYVAPKRYSSSAGSSINPYTEWDADTGVMTKNPDSAPYESDATKSDANQSYAFDVAGNKYTVSNSGVMNYLSKFGSNTHSYKSYDNFGKLYYEALRYLRKLPPTPDFYQHATKASTDEFPVITDWYKGGTDDPVPYYCQKNYIITMGDQFTHCDKRLPGGSLTPYGGGQCSLSGVGNNFAADQGSLAGDTLNVTALTNTIGGYEGLTDLGTGATGRTGSGGNASYYMAGLAHWAATNDIRTDLKNPLVEVNDNGTIRKVETPQTVKTFVIDVEEAQALGAFRTQSAVPPAVPSAYRSQFWYTAKYGGGGGEYGYYEKDTAGKVTPGGNVSGLKWSRGNTEYKTPKQIYNGEWPKALLRAGNPTSMIASIKEALATVDAEVGTNSALSQSSGDLRTSTDASIFRATFDSSVWSGEVQEFTISGDAATLGEIDGTPVWSASKGIPTEQDKRVILSFNDGLNPDNTKDTGTTRGPIAFRSGDFDTKLSARQKAFLNRNGSGVKDDRGALRMNYLRGDATYEAPDGAFTSEPIESWRSRTKVLANGDKVHSLLGDIVNSSPVYVGPPIPNMPGKEYNLFAQGVKNRKPMIYVGANDGMLHAFDAKDGTEQFGYVPSAVYSRLSYLTTTPYGHKYYVDGTPTVSEACKGSCTGEADWFTILVGGLNAGGQGIYALDVTNPNKFAGAESKPGDVALWEFTDRDDSDLGYTFSKPIVRLMNNGKWAAIFGNGFNNRDGDGVQSSTGRAYLYVVPVDGPGTGSWTLGTNYQKIELSASDETGTPLNPENGLASVAGVDRDLDGTVDYIYAGDRRGNLWKIDVSDSDWDNWKSALGTETSPKPLFTAKYTGGSTDTPQAITTGVEVSPHPNGGYMVLFGTGSFIESTDNVGPFNTDSFYGIWDKDDGSKAEDGSKIDGTTVTTGDLQRQKIIATVTSGGVEYLFQSACKPNYNDVEVDSNSNGDLCPSDIAHPSGQGQQLGWVFDLKQDGERVYSEMPLIQAGIVTVTSVQPSGDPCAGNTVGREYNLSYLTGGAAGAGIFDVNGDGAINVNDLINLTTGAPGDETGKAPSGRVFDGGGSRTPLRFQLKKPVEDGGTGTSSYACKDFIPGWGCPSELAPQRNCQRWVEDVVTDELLKAGATGLGGTKKCLPGKAGRLTWRQLVK